MTRELAQSASWLQALPNILKAIGETFQWDWAVYWDYGMGEDTLCCQARNNFV